MEELEARYKELNDAANDLKERYIEKLVELENIKRELAQTKKRCEHLEEENQRLNKIYDAIRKMILDEILTEVKEMGKKIEHEKN